MWFAVADLDSALDQVSWSVDGGTTKTAYIDIIYSNIVNISTVHYLIGFGRRVNNNALGKWTN